MLGKIAQNHPRFKEFHKLHQAKKIGNDFEVTSNVH